MSYFIRNGNTFRVAANEAMDLHNSLPVGNYTVQKDAFGNLYLEMVDSFTPIKRLYGDTQKNADRILNTYRDRPNSTGVMLSGEKGSGKTLLAKTLSIEAAKEGMPTILINQAWCGDTFNKLIQDIDQPCVVLFDEFEKVYDSDEQEMALTLLDGVFPSKKLFVLTCNNKYRVDEHMRNRPGRIYYMLDFSGVSHEFIREYCEENLKNKDHTEKLCQVASLFDKFNFDMLKAVVEEMNRYNETPQEALKMLNAKPEYSSNVDFNIELVVDGVRVESSKLDARKWVGNPLRSVVQLDYAVDVDDDDELSTWESVCFTPADIMQVDSRTGKFVYQNAQGQLLTLNRIEEQTFNYLAF